MYVVSVTASVTKKSSWLPAFRSDRISCSVRGEPLDTPPRRSASSCRSRSGSSRERLRGSGADVSWITVGSGTGEGVIGDGGTLVGVGPRSAVGDGCGVADVSGVSETSSVRSGACCGDAGSVACPHEAITSTAIAAVKKENGNGRRLIILERCDMFMNSTTFFRRMGSHAKAETRIEDFLIASGANGPWD